MAAVTVQSVSKAFGALQALRDVSIAFDDGGFYGLLGPSGSGKTTLLRMIAGFDFPDSGSIAIGGQPVEQLPVEKREIGMMFQNYALFPNMTVFDNVAFGLSVRSIPDPEIRQRVGEALDLVRLTGLDGRKPHQLSGGQRQRVALARAIVTRPRVLLLDEPLSALDKALRVDMQVELKRIQSEVAITTIFVTHDQEEALTLSDRVGILKDGALVQEGEPQALYERPETEFAAKFLGDANILSGTLADGRVTLADGTTIASSNASGKGPVRVAVRPEKIALNGATSENRLSAHVTQRIFAGSSITYLLDWQGETLKVFAQNSGDGAVQEGDTVTLTWSARDSVIVSQQTGWLSVQKDKPYVLVRHCERSEAIQVRSQDCRAGVVGSQ